MQTNLKIDITIALLALLFCIGITVIACREDHKRLEELPDTVVYYCSPEQKQRVAKFTARCASGADTIWVLNHHLKRCQAAAKEMICDIVPN